MDSLPLPIRNEVVYVQAQAHQQFVGTTAVLEQFHELWQRILQHTPNLTPSKIFQADYLQTIDVLADSQVKKLRETRRHLAFLLKSDWKWRPHDVVAAFGAKVSHSQTFLHRLREISTCGVSSTLAVREVYASRQNRLQEKRVAQGIPYDEDFLPDDVLRASERITANASQARFANITVRQKRARSTGADASPRSTPQTPPSAEIGRHESSVKRRRLSDSLLGFVNPPSYCSSSPLADMGFMPSAAATLSANLAALENKAPVQIGSASIDNNALLDIDDDDDYGDDDDNGNNQNPCGTQGVLSNESCYPIIDDAITNGNGNRDDSPLPCAPGAKRDHATVIGEPTQFDYTEAPAEEPAIDSRYPVQGEKPITEFQGSISLIPAEQNQLRAATFPPWSEFELALRPFGGLVGAAASMERISKKEQWLHDSDVFGFLATLNPDPDRIAVIDPLVVDCIHAAVVGRLPERASTCPLVLAPLFVGQNHWTIGVANRETLEYTIFDPLHQHVSIQQSRKAFEALLHLCVKLQSAVQWTFRTCQTTLHQTDCSSCGIYVIMYGLCRMRDIDIPPSIDSNVVREVLSATLKQDLTPSLKGPAALPSDLHSAIGLGDQDLERIQQLWIIELRRLRDSVNTMAAARCTCLLLHKLTEPTVSTPSFDVMSSNVSRLDEILQSGALTREETDQICAIRGKHRLRLDERRFSLRSHSVVQSYVAFYSQRLEDTKQSEAGACSRLRNVCLTLQQEIDGGQ